MITGGTQEVKEACGLIEKEGAASVIPLKVSGAFHSSFMQPAAEKLKNEFEEITINEPLITPIANVNAKPQISPEQIKENLINQITSSVLWVDSIQYMAKQGIQTFLEIGPGKVLRGLLRKIDRNLKCYNIATPTDIENLPF